MNRMRKIVSKKKRRYQKDGFDLDLTYIRTNVIAMGYPADRYEGVYRNNIVDVNRFLSLKHGDKFYVYNLCVESERQYDGARFNNNVCNEFSFEDHNPPTIKLILAFCQHAKRQLNTMIDRTLVIHCKAGKGRTGVMLCCFLLYQYRDEHQHPLETLRFYAQQRTSNGKGVTIPSQRRYVEYFGHLLNHQVQYSVKQILFTGLLITFEQNSILNSSLFYRVSSADHRIQYQSFEVLLERDGTIRRDLFESSSVLNATHKYFIPQANQQCQIPLEEDILIEIFLIKTKRAKPEKLCHFWFNTFFLADSTMQTILIDNDEKYPESNLGVLSSCLISECGHKHLYTMRKKDIDGLHKDKIHRLTPSSFTVSVLFDYIPTSSNVFLQNNSNSTVRTHRTQPLVDSVEFPSNSSTDNSLNVRNQNGTTYFVQRRRTSRSANRQQRTFALYANGISDWDSTDSESALNDSQTNDNQDFERSQTSF